MNLNPEFQRQLYLEFSQARLIGVPMVLGIIFALTYLIDDSHFADVTARSALGLYILIVSFWGCRQVMDSILEEQRSHTWDTQRLSALDPWIMVSGKLLGSTLVVWYGGAICLIVFGMSASNTSKFFWICSYAITSGLLVQSIGLLLSLVSLRKWQVSNNSITMALAFVAAMALGTWIMPLLEDWRTFQDTPDATWYGLNTTAHFLMLITICLALFWCVVGNYRLMAQELSIRTVPWVWLAFVLFMIIYVGGFITSDKFSEHFYISAFSICVLLSYLAVFAEHHEAMRIKRLLTYVMENNWRRSAEELPLWCITFVLAALLSLPLSFIDLTDLDDGFHIYPLSILFLLLRDIGIFLYFNYSKNPQRALSLTMLTFVLLYGVFPGIFSAAEQQWLTALFFPLIAPNIALSLMYSVIQNVLVWYLLYKHWQESV